MNIYKTAYSPNISILTQSYISKNVTPSMISNDGQTGQYDLSFVIQTILNDDVVDDLPKEDFEMLNNLLKEDVNFIEF